MRVVLAISALLVVGLAVEIIHAAEVYSAVPTQFQARWAANDAECARGNLSGSRLTIAETEITRYESRGRILGIAVHEDRHLALIVEATGEGYTWLLTMLLELSDDGTTLTDWTAGPRGAVRIRCSQTED
jgi:hypothetical protein